MHQFPRQFSHHHVHFYQIIFIKRTGIHLNHTAITLAFTALTRLSYSSESFKLLILLSISLTLFSCFIFINFLGLSIICYYHHHHHHHHCHHHYPYHNNSLLLSSSLEVMLLRIRIIHFLRFQGMSWWNLLFSKGLSFGSDWLICQ